MHGVFGFGNAIVLAECTDFLYSAPPAFDETRAEKSVGNVGVVRQRAMLLHKRFGCPSVGKHAIVADIELVAVNAYLNGYACRKILVDKGVEDGLAHSVLGVGIVLDRVMLSYEISAIRYLV